MNKAEYRYVLRWAKKIKAVRMLGGKCIRCAESNQFVLTCHHKNGDEKEAKMKVLFNDARWSAIEAELAKCQLMCNNCHSGHHFDRNNILKNKLIAIKGVDHCETCGYDEYTCSLDFHHLDKTSKEFIISRGYREDRLMLPLDRIITEMDKCQVLCRNCHAMKHFDIDKFERYEDAIMERLAQHVELPKPVDRDRILEMHANGIGVCRIARELGCAKSTVSRALSIASNNN